MTRRGLFTTLAAVIAGPSVAIRALPLNSVLGQNDIDELLGSMFPEGAAERRVIIARIGGEVVRIAHWHNELVDLPPRDGWKDFKIVGTHFVLADGTRRYYPVEAMPSSDFIGYEWPLHQPVRDGRDLG